MYLRSILTILPTQRTLEPSTWSLSLEANMMAASCIRITWARISSSCGSAVIATPNSSSSHARTWLISKSWLSLASPSSMPKPISSPPDAPNSPVCPADLAAPMERRCAAILDMFSSSKVRDASESNAPLRISGRRLASLMLVSAARLQKSEIEAKGSSPRASQIWFATAVPTPLIASRP